MPPVLKNHRSLWKSCSSKPLLKVSASNISWMMGSTWSSLGCLDVVFLGRKDVWTWTQKQPTTSDNFLGLELQHVSWRIRIWLFNVLLKTFAVHGTWESLDCKQRWKVGPTSARFLPGFYWLSFKMESSMMKMDSNLAQTWTEEISAVLFQRTRRSTQ